MTVTDVIPVSLEGRFPIVFIYCPTHQPANSESTWLIWQLFVRGHLN